MRVDRSLIYKFCVAEYNLSFVDLYIFDEFVITQAKEGISYSKSELITLVGAISKHFDKEEEFDFISNRVNDFSIDPNDLRWFLQTLDNVRSYNVVYYDSPSKAHLSIESLFAPLPVQSFPHLVIALEALYTSSQQEVNYSTPSLN